MALLIDTDLLIDLEKQGSAVQNLLADEESAISVITVSELLHGVLRAHGANPSSRHAFVEHLLCRTSSNPDHGARRSRPCRDLGATRRAGRARRRPRSLDRCHRHAHGFGVATRNISHFERIPSLRGTVSPTT